MKIKDVELEIDFLDAETAQLYEDKLHQLQEYKPKNKLSLAGTIKEQCELIFDFIDTLFGAGASAAIFGEKCNLREALEAFNAVIEEFKRQQAEIVAEISLSGSTVGETSSDTHRCFFRIVE